MKKIFVILFSLLVLLGLSRWVLAEDKGAKTTPFMDSEPKSNDLWQKKISEIKNSTENLIKENETLTSENGSLNGDLAKTQESLENYKEENKELSDKTTETRAFVNEQKDKTKAIQNEIDNLNKEISEVATKNSSLKEELSTLSESQKLWKLKAADLKAKRSSLDLDLKLENSLSPQDQQKLEGVNALENKLTGNKQEEKELDQLILEEKNEIPALKENVEIFKKENERLSAQIVELQKQKNLQDKKNAGQKSAKPADAQAVEREYAKKLAEKKELEKSVTTLEQQIEEVENSIDGVSQIQFRKRHLLDQIMSLDEENQTLRSQISELKQNLTELKKDSSMMKTDMEMQPEKAPEDKPLEKDPKKN